MLTRDQLLERVWGYTFAGDTRTVDVHVRQIRRKLGDASPIVTVWGVGYKVAHDRSTAAPGRLERRALDLHFECARVAALPPAGLVSPRDRARRVSSPPISLCGCSRRTRGASRSRSSAARRQGISQLYADAALRAADEGSGAIDFAASKLELATGDRIFYFGASLFPGQDSGLQRLPEVADAARR